jgi:hypothetical protein
LVQRHQREQHGWDADDQADDATNNSTLKQSESLNAHRQDNAKEHHTVKKATVSCSTRSSDSVMSQTSTYSARECFAFAASETKAPWFRYPSGVAERAIVESPRLAAAFCARFAFAASETKAPWFRYPSGVVERAIVESPRSE